MKIEVMMRGPIPDSTKEIVDYGVTEQFLIIYEKPDAKTYIRMDLIAGIRITGPEIEDEIEDRIEEVQRNSRD